MVRVSLQYHPQAGEIMRMVAALFGEDSGVRIDDCDALPARPSTPWPISCPQDLRMLQ
jgi:hypothetical protein